MREFAFLSLNTLSRLVIAPALVASALALPGCAGKKGEIVVALQTDMSLPEDVDKVRIRVLVGDNGRQVYGRTFNVDPNADPDDGPSSKIPATLAIAEGETENEVVQVLVTGFRGTTARTLNKTITTMPSDRVAMLHVPVQWLCSDTPDDPKFVVQGDPDDPDDVESGCPDADEACVAGKCQPVKQDEKDLPDFSEGDVFGGEDEGSEDGTCFPALECFSDGFDVVPDEDCVVELPAAADENVNFAVHAAQGGIRLAEGGDEGYVALDKGRNFGWAELETSGSDDGAGGSTAGGGMPEGGTGVDVPPQEAPSMRRFQLPEGVCELLSESSGRILGIRASTSEACVVTKTPRYPNCGPWAGVGKLPTEPPPDGDDADGDGFVDENAGGDDCDDTDDTVYPGAPEACDEIDNDCDGVVDDSCVMDLPFSHHVDFSGVDDFTSRDNYAIYQRFDSETPLDLDQQTVTFTPNAENTAYVVTRGELEWDSDVGEIIPVSGVDVSSCDDCFVNAGLEFPFNFFGTEYSSVFPSSNGYLTFGSGDSTYSETVEYFLGAQPRIAALFDDLDTRGPSPDIEDEVRFFTDGSKAVITYLDIQHYSYSMTSNTFQFVLLDDGTIKISYDGMEDLTQGSITGITPGRLSVDGTCPSGLTDCDGACVDTLSDAGNCGTCGEACESGESCTNGTCLGGVSCNVTSLVCDGRCLGNCEVDAEPCAGTCFGTCDGTCDPDPGDGQCNGTCDGDCTGTCYLSEATACGGECSGTCYLPTGSTCPEPASQGPCSFSSQVLSDESNCSDYVTDAIGNYYQVNCSAGECQCCVNSNCTSLATSATTICESVESLRSELMTCADQSACGAGCPAENPGTDSDCVSADVNYCYYQDASYCYCQEDVFACFP